MDRRTFLNMTLCSGLVLTTLAAPAAARGEDAADGDGARMALPAPETNGGKPLMQALALRHSTRRFSREPVSQQLLGDLLWAVWGVNRPDGRRTAPTAMDRRDVAVYAVLESGVWRYEAEAHALVRVLSEDHRAAVGGAPVILLYAAPQGPWSGMHVGSLYQNAGLYCASVGLGNVVRASGVSALQGKLPLPSGYSILMTQAIGWPE